MNENNPTQACPGVPGSLPIELLTKAEVARIVKRSMRHVQNLLNKRLIPRPIRIGGGRPLWRRTDIERWIAAGCPSSSAGRQGHDAE
jgi:predicted DNA-binding transcriptional regulator AlpA